MSKSVVIIHGSMGYPQENWFPWIKNELEKDGYRVSVPSFPTPEGQSFDAWLDVFRQLSLDANTVVIGHSTGAIFILNMLQALSIKIRAAYLVAPFSKSLGNEFFDGLNKSFFEYQRNYDVICQGADLFKVYYSDNDPYVPEHASVEVASALNVVPIKISGAGHFNAAASYDTFPALLSSVLSV